MTFRRTLLAATTLVALPIAAGAQPVTGLYIGGGAGANWVQTPSHVDLSAAGTGLPDNVNVTVSNAGKVVFKTGYVGVLSLGWGFGNGWRAEIEGNFRANEVDSIRGFNLAPIASTGGFQYTYGAMGNIFYDFDFANFGLPPSIFQPYVGLGAGYAWTEWRNVRGNSVPGNVALNIDDTSGNFAYQAILGVATPLTWAGVRGLTLTGEFRFFGTLQPELRATSRSIVTPTLASTVTAEPRNYNYAVLFGLRYAFFQPPPPPPPAAPAPAVAPAPARTYLVFFDWDRADLTPRAREIIADAATNAGRVQTTRIEVAGHADRSGSPQYNQRLSQRRADVVAAELVTRGVRRNDIVVTAYGESRPLVPTADGVREPQNRRVEIVLR